MNPINARTVRFWAWVDSAVTVALALPPLAERFVALLYTVNGWTGGVSEAPTFEPIHLLFVCLLGALVSVWVIARLLRPLPLFGLIDGWGRAWVAAILLWFVCARDAPPVILFFVFTEGAGAVAQLWAGYRLARGAPESAE